MGVGLEAEMGERCGGCCAGAGLGQGGTAGGLGVGGEILKRDGVENEVQGVFVSGCQAVFQPRGGVLGVGLLLGQGQGRAGEAQALGLVGP